MKKCAGYIRVSKGELYQGTSLENQKEFLIQQAKLNNLEIVEFYIDTKTGTTTRRPELKRLIEDFKSQKFQVIISKESGRIARNMPLACTFKNSSEVSNVDIITFDGAINTLTGDTQLWGLYAWLNEIEAENCSRRQKARIRTRANNGLFNGSTPPYGYYCEHGKLFINNDDTPQIVQYIFNEYIKGVGIDSIAKSLSKDGVPTPSMVAKKKNAGYLWHGTTITKILKNEAYIGNMVQLKEQTKNAISEKRIKNEESNVIRVENTHEAIISKEDFKIVQELLKNRSVTRTHQSTHLFTNIAFCADCGKGMHFKKNSKGYVCGGFNKHSTIACSHHRVREAELVDKILTDINTLVSSVSLVKRNTINLDTKFEKTRLKLETKINSLDDKIEKLKNAEFNIYIDYKSGELSKEQYKLFTDKLEKEINYANRTLADSKKALDKLKNTSISEVKSSLENIPLTITSLTPEIINKFIKRIEISEAGDAKIFYRFSTPNTSI